jgi:hypothetical protein
MSDRGTTSYRDLAHEAWRAGYTAGRRGVSEADNPHARDSELARAWTFGLINGRTRPLRLVPEVPIAPDSRPCD